MEVQQISVSYTQERRFSLIRFKAWETSNNWLKTSKLVTCLKSDSVLIMTQYCLMQGKPGSHLERIAKSRSGNSRVLEKYKQCINTSITFAPPQTFTVSSYHKKDFRFATFFSLINRKQNCNSVTEETSKLWTNKYIKPLIFVNPGS